MLAVATAQQQPKLKILSFGGNGMIGSETLTSLIATGDYDITLVSRGNWPYDADTRVQPHVKHVECDRSEGFKTCPELMADIDATQQYYAVLDFSGFYPAWVRDAVEVLKDKVRVYIYVSTDSVYEVSTVPPYSETGRKMIETDAVRPETAKEREALNEEDDYGDDKLAGEEVLVEQRDGGKAGVPFVALRFADVVGPRDATDRYVIYHLWIKNQGFPRVPAFHIPEDIVEATSITYVNDAAASVIAAMNKPESWDEAYNIACEEIFNVTDVIITMGNYMGKENLRPLKVPQDDSFALFPSVLRGPMDISKAREKLGFKPTPLDVVLRKTLDWYNAELESNEEFLDASLQEWGEAVFDSEEEAEEIIDEIFDELTTDEL